MYPPSEELLARTRDHLAARPARAQTLIKARSETCPAGTWDLHIVLFVRRSFSPTVSHPGIRWRTSSSTPCSPRRGEACGSHREIPPCSRSSTTASSPMRGAGCDDPGERDPARSAAGGGPGDGGTPAGRAGARPRGPRCRARGVHARIGGRVLASGRDVQDGPGRATPAPLVDPTGRLHGSRTSTSPTPRSCRRSPLRTPTYPSSPSPSGSPSCSASAEAGGGGASARRFASTRMTAKPTLGRSRSMLSNSRWPIRIVRTSPTATSEAMRGVCVMRDISPTTSPLGPQGQLPLRSVVLLRHPKGPLDDDVELLAELPLRRHHLAVRVAALVGDRRHALQIGRGQIGEQRDLPEEEHALDRRERARRRTSIPLPAERGRAPRSER